MFFDQEEIIFQIMDVFSLEQSDARSYNAARRFDALSYRFSADTKIETEKGSLSLSDHSLCFVPAHVDYVRVTKHDKLIVVNFKTFNYCSTAFESFTPQEYEKYEVLFTKLLNTWNQKEVSYKHACASILSHILQELYKDTRFLYAKDSKLAEALTYINQNCLRRDFSLQEAASVASLSESYFRKLFKEEYHLSPKKYVIRYRMQHAASLILTGYFPLQEISDMCGYEDYKHFSVEFKKVLGVSPSQYRYNQPIIDKSFSWDTTSPDNSNQ